ncbi:hypothetical protein BCV71DRAFT_235404 [Rhizopus microsporus]|uniref:Uncharacterized protein n=1 Tax=Rhizopus microsporus TaxID=58291 RepID=A0A1X0S0X1_RHIZD|nr:hypothetical protein BCV71DRAFT_235404 [Rhizopus microsporus]
MYVHSQYCEIQGDELEPDLKLDTNMEEVANKNEPTSSSTLHLPARLDKGPSEEREREPSTYHNRNLIFIIVLEFLHLVFPSNVKKNFNPKEALSTLLGFYEDSLPANMEVKEIFEEIATVWEQMVDLRLLKQPWDSFTVALLRMIAFVLTSVKCHLMLGAAIVVWGCDRTI